jgi:hypothetical protein
MGGTVNPNGLKNVANCCNYFIDNSDTGGTMEPYGVFGTTVPLMIHHTYLTEETLWAI